MCRNVVASGRPQTTIWRTSIAYCVHKSTNTYSEYVKPMLFHCKNVCTKSPQCYVYIYIASLFAPFSVWKSRDERHRYFSACIHFPGKMCKGRVATQLVEQLEKAAILTVKFIEEGLKGSRRMCLPICALGARRLRVLNTTPRPLYPSERPAFLVQEDGWAARPV